MPVDRPTFSESWYRVAELHPRMRATVQVHRQYFRGSMWHVIQDPANNQFFRLNEPAYRFIALLDGKRTVAEAWKICNEQEGDNAPTQGEAIRLLGQLYASNLLSADLAPDTESLFNRYRKRIKREIQSYLSNLLFIRLPILDPDHFLDATVGFFGKAFTLFPGLLIWLLCVAWGVYSLMGHWDGLSQRAGGVLSMENLPLLYVAFTLIKAIHEFGHAFACKKFGQESGSGGEVHVMGIMFLVFTPMPYVDASSSWAFRSKWHRMIVGAAGMYVEMAVAGLAAVVWANTSAGAVNAIAYNVMFIASVSTLIFNANPLLRYDGYYMLSDLLEIPNLAQRGKEYLYYLVKKYAWGVRQAQNPSHSPGERAWLLSYALCSTVYRWFICVAILLFVAGALFIVGMVLAVAAVIAWVCVPIGKFIYYLASNPELMRVRPRAVASTLVVLGGLIAALGTIPFPDRYRVEAVVSPAEYAIIHADADGFVHSVSPSGTTVLPRQDVLVGADNPQLKAELDLFLLERKRLELLIAAQTVDINAKQIAQRDLSALTWPTEWRKRRVAALQTLAPMAGTWVSPEIDRLKGAYVRRGDSLGIVAGLDNLIIRAVAGQEAAPVLVEEMEVKGNRDVGRVEIMVRGRPDDKLFGHIQQILVAGENDLPSAALGMEAGGSVATVQEARQPGSPAKSAERFFEVRIKPGEPVDPSHPVKLYSGQLVIVRFSAPAKPLMEQWYRALLQLVQRKFHV